MGRPAEGARPIRTGDDTQSDSIIVWWEGELWQATSGVLPARRVSENPWRDQDAGGP